MILLLFVQIRRSKNTALRAIQNSLINAVHANTIDTERNAINIENSSRYFIDSNFIETIHSTIAVIGNKSNPIFHNYNLIEIMNIFCVICEKRYRFLFDNSNFIYAFEYYTNLN